MNLIRSEDTLHKATLLILLKKIADNPQIISNIYFKGGTCASMLGYLDRFSVDLDFDLKKAADKKSLEKELAKTFKNLGFKIQNKSRGELFYILKYDAPENQRNTLKLSIFDLTIRANIYQPSYLAEIDRIVKCQTIETMFANKLVAPIDRYDKHEKIAGRDIYDIHHFFSQGYPIRYEIIEERMKIGWKDYLKKLSAFIKNKITETIINEDLNTLLPSEKFQKIRENLKSDTLIYLNSAITT